MLDRDANVFAEMIGYCDDVSGKISRFGVNRTRWVHDRFVRESILFSLAYIGECVGHLKDERSLDEFPDVTWKDVKGLRNFIFHHYRDVDLDSAWESATGSVPELRRRLLQNSQVRGAYECLGSEDDEALDDVLDMLPTEPIVAENYPEPCPHDCPSPLWPAIDGSAIDVKSTDLTDRRAGLPDVGDDGGDVR